MKEDKKLYQIGALGHCIPPPRHVLPGFRSESGSVIRIATKMWSFVHWPTVNLAWKFHANPFGSFCTTLLKFQKKQTNNDENITSLAEVI